VRIAVAQLNPTVGDIEGQTERIIETYTRVASSEIDLVVFPELYLVGYPPRDLLERTWFIERVERALDRLARLTEDRPETGLLLGVPVRNGQQAGKDLHNAAVLLHRGRVEAVRAKSLLPSYDVFDETRYFARADEVRVVPFKGERLGISICEDAWNDPALWPSKVSYSSDPIAALAEQGATLLVNISASPYWRGKERIRHRLISGHARRHKVPFLYVNQVGGNDELLFDGRSMAIDARGNPIALFPSFEEAVDIIDMRETGAPHGYEAEEEIATVHKALVMGLRDYARKCGFKTAVLGLSGGIDSAVTACLAAAALGAENVLGISMPSQYSSTGSIEDSRKLAENLGIDFRIVPIADVFGSYLVALEAHFRGLESNVAEENIQARIRGNMLMAFSNKFGYLVLSTGNKSELAVGYCTLYGDMSGGLAVISDVPKMMVYELAHYINRERAIIPEASITKPPSAELRPNQTDQDTLPPYEVLDAILEYYVEDGFSVEEIVARGFEDETVRWVVRTVNRNEFKRRQAAPGLKVTTKAFGSGRRMPIAARFDV